MLRLALLTVCILYTALGISASGQYSVIGPGTIHPGHKYNVAVAVHHTTEPAEIKVGITGPLYNETKIVQLKDGEVKEVEFNVPYVEKGTYNLTAEGLAGVEFKKNSTKLNFNEFKPHVKIQTDKGIYKPGDDLNFRIVFLDKNLRPAVPDKKTVIVIEDEKRNRLKEYKNVQAIKGVYTGKFHISEYASLGNWHLIVENTDSYPQTAYFSVSKYVPPKYNVNVKATENVSVKDGDMQIIARSNYTYGKPVNAKVTFLIQLMKQYSEENNKEDPPAIIRTADMVNGKAKLDLNVKQYEPYMPYKTSATYLEITATVEENFTGVKLNATTSTTLYPFRYLMNCVSYETCSSFEAEKPFEVVFQLTYVDGTHLADTKSIVKLTFTEQVRKHTWWYGMKENQTVEEPKLENRVMEYEGHMNSTGHVTFAITLPDLQEFEGFDHYFEKHLKYKDENREIYRHYQYRKPKQVEIPETKEPTEWFAVRAHLDPETYNTQIGKEIIFTLNSSQPIPYFVYNIIGRGNIIAAKRVDLPENTKIFNLTIIPTFDMAPHGAFYAYYVDAKGEFHYAETTFYVKVQLQNQIELKVPKQVKPGTEVGLHIKTTPDSFVGIVAVDQSVLEMRDVNYFSKNDFDWRLGSFSTHTPWQGGYSHYPGTNVGVVTLTNADYFYNWTNPYVPDQDGGFQLKYASLARSGVGVVNDAVASPEAAAEPGLRSAVASSMGGASGGSVAVPVRRDFSETWIFADIENTETDEFVWTKKIPDTITKWVISAFSLHPTKGLGVLDERASITTFQPFFISIRLPYSVKRGEVINVPALVFNYLEKDLDVKVTLDNADGEYDFTEVSNEVINEQSRIKTVRVPANSAAGISFMIRPKIIGNILLKFTAESPIAGDAVHKTLKVVPEGITEYANRAYFVNLKDTANFETEFDLALPEEIVKDSQHVEFAVVGDLLGPIFLHLNSLLRVPMGCGEQTTSKLVPNSIVLKYLKTADKLTPALEREIKSNLETGYQHILNFQHKDGSFSSFGYSLLRSGHSINGSTWLTAYVVRSLHHAKQHIDVDTKVLHKGLEFLIAQQAENGSFLEHGDYFFAAQSQHLSLTASVVLALVESEDLAAKHQRYIDSGIKYIEENWDKSDNLRDKIITTYTLQRAKHPAASKQIAALKVLAKTEDDRMWWAVSERPSQIWWRWLSSNDVEITSYMLLTLLDSETETVESVLPIVRWLVAQRNSYGGFASTQDTVMGLQALVKFIEKSGYKPAIMDIDYTAQPGKITRAEPLHINEDNNLLLQKFELPEKTTSISFKAKGHGAALVQISYQYNIVEKDKSPSFSIKTLINKETPERKLEMDVCVEYQDEGPSSNMAIVEVTLPSGYIVDADTLHLLKEVDRVRHVETKNSESVIVVYFESLRKGYPSCLTINALKAFAVALQKPSPIVAYDYYATERRATGFYHVSSKMCDICEEDEECKKACS